MSSASTDRVATPPPAELTSYVGRRDEGADVRRLLGKARLVTLSGPGGVGKTRLAWRVVRDVARAFPDGVVFVELAEVRDGALAANLVADRLGLHDRSGLSPMRQVLDHLRNRALLLVLDNCEHLIDACAEFVAAVLTDCPKIVVLATSRQSFAVAGEHVLPVPPLPVADAVRLFRERAAAAWPEAADGASVSEETLTELCDRLDGLPLAIELAAARIRSLSPCQILDRLTSRLTLLTSGLRTGPERHKTLRATIDWSHDLCSPSEQSVWARLSVFVGSFDLEAAQQVCAYDGIGEESVLELVEGLLDKSVLIRRQQTDGVRFQMLESLREYGQERLDQAGDQGRVSRLHRDWMARLVEQADDEWVSGRQPYWIERLGHDHANLRAALSWSVSEPDEAGAALRMAVRPIEYWLLRGLAGEAGTWLDRALAATPEEHPDRARALCASALHTLWQGNQEKMARLVSEAESLAEKNADEPSRARARHVRSFAAMLAIRPESVDLAAATCAAFRALGETRAELHPLFIHGVSVAYRDRDLDAARRSLQRMSELTGADGESFYRAMSLFGQAMVEVAFGDVAVAAEAATEALRLDLRVGNQQGIAYRTDALAWVADRQGDHVRAATLFGIAATRWERIGLAPEFAASLPHAKHTAAARAAIGDTRFDRAFDAGRAIPADEAVNYALGEPARKPDGVTEKKLTTRETEIAKLIAKGLTNRDIAARLVISQRTVDSHVEHILAKLGFGNRTQIAAWVAGHGR
ncbi:LuxR C-terminal-related transcriptional regulator [Amycolatopsis japonica]|uniref:LuxR C-terminal-related transcriptional regulator n=1 Tax=Amycolatopsis japonica TaxID=208439 RepID=UPI0033F4B934